MPKSLPKFEKEVERRLAVEDTSLRRTLKPREIAGEGGDLRQRVMRRKQAEELLKTLPMIDCGLCGAPTCKSHADDVASSRAEIGKCVFLSRDRIDDLRRIYTDAQIKRGSQ